MSRPPCRPEIRRLIETEKGIEVVVINRSRCLSQEPQQVATTHPPKIFNTSLLQKCNEKGGSVGSRTRLEKALLQELEEKLKPLKNKVEQQIEERKLRRHQSDPVDLLSCDSNPTPCVVSWASHSPCESSSVMDERLNKMCVSSNFEIDRIVKESKTTTITETRETIHFRPPEEGKPVQLSIPSTPVKRLSIRAPTDIEKRQDPPHIYVNISETNECKKKSPQPHKNGNGLIKEYSKLEEEIKDINQRNSELRKKFFEDQTKETPILPRTNPKTENIRKPSMVTTSTSPSAQPLKSLLTPAPHSGHRQKTTGSP